MQAIIVILIVIAAAAYLLWRIRKYGLGSSCGYSGTSCVSDKNNCSSTKDATPKKL
jgi:hypothetical protein